MSYNEMEILENREPPHFIARGLSEILMSMIRSEDLNIEHRLAKLEIQVSKLEKDSEEDRKDMKDFISGASKFRNEFYKLKEELGNNLVNQHIQILNQVGELKDAVNKKLDEQKNDLKDKEIKIYQAFFGLIVSTGALTWLITKLVNQ